MNMPPIVEAYFEADRRNELDAMAKAFSVDAIVRDEAVIHKGIAAIRDWWSAAKAKYNHVAQPLEVAHAGEQIVVRAEVTGDFPNSPVTLDFFFTVEDGKIIALEIR